MTVKVLNMRKQNRNDDDFEISFKEHYTGLCTYAYNLVGDRFEAEDIVQQFFIKLWDKREDFRIDSFSSYAYRSVRNSCLNRLIKSGRNKEESIENLTDRLLADFNPGEEPAYVYQDIVRKVLRQIPEKCRQILFLHCISGLKYKEIADTMGISVNTVKSQIAVAYKILREGLGDLFPLLLLFWQIK